eukprot:scaffold41996_cov32-Prasinocladus_malaysianus.AAC.1
MDLENDHEQAFEYIVHHQIVSSGCCPLWCCQGRPRLAWPRTHQGSDTMCFKSNTLRFRSSNVWVGQRSTRVRVAALAASFAISQTLNAA